MEPTCYVRYFKFDSPVRLANRTSSSCVRVQICSVQQTNHSRHRTSVVAPSLIDSAQAHKRPHTHCTISIPRSRCSEQRPAQHYTTDHTGSLLLVDCCVNLPNYSAFLLGIMVKGGYTPHICRQTRNLVLPLLELQSRFGGNPVKFQAACSQNGTTAVLKGKSAKCRTRVNRFESRDTSYLTHEKNTW